MEKSRMFSRKVVESDNFLEMSLPAQAAYFHICLSCEKKGLVNNAYAIAREIGGDRSAVDELIDKKYLVREDVTTLRIVHLYENNGIGETHKKRNNYSYRKWRKSVIERDGKCGMCGSEKDLEAHHIKHFAEYPELALDLNNGLTLCKSCHKKLHREERLYGGAQDVH